ncbi:MAG: ribonuclease Y, partial [Phycisphaerae bacterium]|nr:ribonuclease Y [Phycisphaerae bacterium]
MQNILMLAVENSTAIGIGIVAGFAGAVASWITQNVLGKSKIQAAEQKYKTIIDDATLKSDNIIKSAQLESKADIMEKREAFEKEIQILRNELRESEKHLSKREDSVDRKWESLTVKERSLEKRDKKINAREHDIANKDEQLSNTLAEQRAQLLKCSGMSEGEAREILLKRLEDEVEHEASNLIENIVTRATEEAESRSREITINAIQRYAAGHTCDSTVSTVDIENDEMKGRVIGREGRNIRAFEQATGVDVIIDDTPGIVVVSAFDPVRREVARQSLQKLIQDGRIHPARIEELVIETQKEMENRIYDIGKKVVLEANVNGLNNKLLPYLGRLNYRTSYGQNVLRHSVEVAFLAQVMAEELGLDGNLARRCGILHDIGKAVDHEVEGGHPQIGADLVRKFNEKHEVLNAIAGHHGDIAAESPYTPLIAAADAMSASRPGASRETLERYIKRLENLENIANEFKGVKKSYAIQAGREIRVIVDPE